MLVAILAGGLLALHTTASWGVSVGESTCELDEAVPVNLAPHHPTQVLVRLRDGVSDAAFAAALAPVRGKIEHAYTLVPQLRLVTIGVPVREAIFTLGGRPDLIEYVEPNFLAELDAQPNDPRFFEQTGMFTINAESAWDVTTGDPDFIVAVVDTGIEPTHPDLAANLWANPGEIADNLLDDDGNGFVDDVHGWDFQMGLGPLSADGGSLHGTLVSGIIAAVGNNNEGVAGVCWNARILAAKFTGEYRGGTIEGAIRATEYSILHGAKLSNHSWGSTGTSQALEDAVVAAGAHDHLLVTAAGNASLPFIPQVPGSYGATHDNVVTVAAVDQSEAIAPFSNYSPTVVALGAPGVQVLSTVYDYVNDGHYNFDFQTYYAASGTSLAAPHVTGVAALVWSLHPDWTHLDVRDVLYATARQTPALQGKVSTGGIVDAAAAVRAHRPVRLSMFAPLPTETTTGASVNVLVTAFGEAGAGGQVTAHYRQPGIAGFSAVVMTAQGDDVYSATIPVGSRAGRLDLYVSASFDGVSGRLPEGGENSPLSIALLASSPRYSYDFQDAQGWMVGIGTDHAGTGVWEWASPSPTLAQPGGDRHGPSGRCFVTGADPGATVSAFDVDGGATSLVSPRLDLSGESDLTVGYWLWYSTDKGGSPNDDRLRVLVSSDDGATWALADTVGPGGEQSRGQWRFHAFQLDPGVARTSAMRVLFEASDFGPASVVEAAVDDVFITNNTDVPPRCPADFNNSGNVTVQDVFDFLGTYFTGAPAADFNHADGITIRDIFEYLGAYFMGC